MNSFRFLVNITNMDFKNFFYNLFKYNSNKNYDFSIINDKVDTVPHLEEETNSIFPSIKENLDFMKSKYNTLLNSDIVIREFNLFVYNQNHKCFIIYIDGMVDGISINDFILKPLMSGKLRYNKPIENNLSEYIDYCLLPQNHVKKVEEFKSVFNGINIGNCLLFIDTINVAFDIDAKKLQQRSVDKPENEAVIKGSHEAFVENIRTNKIM